MNATGATAVSGELTPSKGAKYGLAILFLVAVFNYIDRSILSLLQEPLKAELGLSDTQLGMLTGLSFALVYSTVALPVARIADRVNRKKLVAAALAIWSAATACCGLANGFGTLALLRMGVAFGESGCVPASHSMIADYYPPRRRATALAIWGLSNPVGTMFGFAMAGWLTHVLGWREAFLVFGIVGVLLAPIVLTVREPKRGTFDARGDEAAHAATPDLPPIPFREAISILWNRKAFRLLALGGAAHAFVIHLLHNWNAPFYGRMHDMPIGDVALYLALATGLGGGLGQFLGGWLTDHLAKYSMGWYMWLPALASLLLLPVSLMQYLVPGASASMAWGVGSLFLIAIFYAPLVATAQAVVGARMRAFTSAVLVLTTNILGLSIGPLVAGLISDGLAPAMGSESLRWAIVILLPVSLIAAGCFYFAGRHVVSEAIVKEPVAKT